MTNSLPPNPSLTWLKKTAKQTLRTLQQTKPDAKLADVQYALARKYGFKSWRELKKRIDMQTAMLEPTTTEASINRFFQAVAAGDTAEAALHLRRQPELIHQTGPHPFWSGRPQALHVSIETNQPDMFSFLLAAGANVDGDNHEYDQWSPLMLSIHWKQNRIRQELLAAGARIDLLAALLLGDDERVKAFLSTGRSALDGLSPSAGSILAFARTPFAIDRLLALGAPTDIKDKWGATPMEAFSRLGPAGKPLVAHFRRHGIAVQPAEYARMGDKSALEILLENELERVINDDVLLAAVDFSHHELAIWLLQQGANPNARARSGSGQTALHSAAWNGDQQMVEILLDAGAKLGALDEEHQNTPAGWAKVALQVTNNRDCEGVAAFLANAD